MSPEEILAYESRVRVRQVVVAVVAGVLLIVAAVLTLTGPHTKVSELTLDLLTANKRFPLDLIAAILNAVAALAAAWTLVFLYRAAHARNPEKVRPYLRIIAITAGVVSAVAGVAYAIIVASKVHTFATTGMQTYAEANRLTSGGALTALQLLGQLGALLVALSFVLVSLQAMNQGLLSRFMGYLGMFAGALFLFQVTQVPVVQCYWLLAVAYLISGRWPTGVPPAWRSGRAEPWPSSAEMRNRRAAAAGAGAGRAPVRAGGAAGGGGGGGGLAGGLGALFGSRSRPAPAPAPRPTQPASEARTRSNTPKRKRKRRS
ncbi:MAG TPA: hypothetical protein VFN87_22515 [Solirubrobacteraceae bacterium]|nr:hypothetical protein [Solirubrobacteraceae bacterium]